MAVAGSLTYDTEIDKSGFEKGLNSLKSSASTTGNQIKSIVTALGVDKIISMAFTTITSSIDGAISRLDTLNNYPKVMSNLGIASEDAEKSIDKMSEKLSGLPTTLNDGALAVQRFTSANGNVKKSTDYFLALNNAILAGGASTDIQSTALEQLSQSYAKGKPDMMEWRSLMTAMPAQLKQVATAMGYVSTDALGEDLRNGIVSMDEFMDTIVKLNNEGVNGFQSFEVQARNSTGGISTSITVAKTQIVKGVADIISAIDQFLKDEGLGGISEIISNIGKKSKEVLDFAAENLPNIINFIRDMVPYIEAIGISILSWKIGTTIQNAVQGFQSAKIALALYSMETNGASIAQGLFNGTLTLGETLVGLFTGKITLAELATAGLSKAQAILNAVMSANPIALVVLAVGALIAIFVVLWKKCEWFRNFWIKLFENIKNVVLKVIEFIKENWQGLVLFLVNPFAGAFKLLYDNCESFRNFVNNFIQNIKDFFVNGWNSIVSFFSNTIPQWISNVISWIAKLPYNIGYFIGQIIGNVINFGVEIWNWITVDLPEIIRGILDWFSQLPGKIWDFLVNAYNNILQWGIDSYNTAVQWISDTINGIISWFSRLPGRIWDWLLNTYYNILNWLTNTKQKMNEGVSNIINSVVTWFSELPNKMAEIGSNIVSGIWNGIVGAKDWLIGKVVEFSNGILKGMKDALGIHSPSSKARDLVGKRVPEGVAVGIEANTSEAIKAIDRMDDEIIREMNKSVDLETGNINANATVKSNNTGYQVITVDMNLGGVNMDGKKVGQFATPHIIKTMKTVGVR